ncbi:IclR family transcriptional regulator [Acidimangrovimonas pyrenivorans]|uniref:IclR family transcriptional regulator n=1 Tax=Acidimangrovimonas pyrenivorans TaxID=2030798 RepID=A0ABV7AEK0_9RHOB
MGTITKALDLLNLFSRSHPALKLGDFVRLSGRDKATVHRHLVELTENGFLEQDAQSRAYRLGPAILRLTAVREATMPMRSVVGPIVTRVAQEVGELVHFSLLQGSRLSPVFHADPGRHGTQVHFDEAEILPLHATSSGLAVLAFAPEELRDAVRAGPLEPHASGALTDAARLDAALAKTRQSGLGIIDKGFDDEVASVAAPVFGPDGGVVGALAIAVPIARMSAAKRAEIRARLPGGVSQITDAIGGHLPAELARAWQAAATAPAS